MSSDKLLTAAQQTTTQILEDATKVRELLRVDDEIASINDERDSPMEVDDLMTLMIAGSTSTESTCSCRDWNNSIINHNGQIHPQVAHTSSLSDNSQQPCSTSSNSNNDKAGPSSINNITTGTSNKASAAMTTEQVERAIQQVAYRCQRQIGELIAYIGENFCSANVIRARQRTLAPALPLSQETLKKDFREISKLVFSGVQRLLHYNESDCASIS
jgi:hypothetical protein